MSKAIVFTAADNGIDRLVLGLPAWPDRMGD